MIVWIYMVSKWTLRFPVLKSKQHGSRNLIYMFSAIIPASRTVFGTKEESNTSLPNERKKLGTPQMLPLPSFTLCFRYCEETKTWKTNSCPQVVYNLVEVGGGPVEGGEAFLLCCTTMDKSLVGPQSPQCQMNGLDKFISMVSYGLCFMIMRS